MQTPKRAVRKWEAEEDAAGVDMSEVRSSVSPPKIQLTTSFMNFRAESGANQILQQTNASFDFSLLTKADDLLVVSTEREIKAYQPDTGRLNAVMPDSGLLFCHKGLIACLSETDSNVEIKLARAKPLFDGKRTFESVGGLTDINLKQAATCKLPNALKIIIQHGR